VKPATAPLRDVVDPRGREVEIAALGARLSTLRLCEPDAVADVQRSLDRHGQLTPLVVIEDAGHLETLDGFKRLRAARAIGWTSLRVDVLAPGLGVVDAKLAFGALHARRGLTELEEAWLIRSLVRDDGLRQGDVAHRLHRHKSWICRRLMLAESLDGAVQADVRLGLVAPRTAVALAALPRGNQVRAAEVVIRTGMTLRQTEAMVFELLELQDPVTRVAWLDRRLTATTAAAPAAPAVPAPTARQRAECDWMLGDLLTLRRVGARLEARLLARPLAAHGPGAAASLLEALVGLTPVLAALTTTVARAVAEQHP
jgi:ParB-like chromosome segregation protein Spo0J